MPYKSHRTYLNNHMGSMYMMPLVINSLVEDKHKSTYTHTDICRQTILINYVGQVAPDLTVNELIIVYEKYVKFTLCIAIGTYVHMYIWHYKFSLLIFMLCLWFVLLAVYIKL